MSPDEVNAVLVRIPPDQRNDAAKRIYQAHGWGWTDIGIWEWGGLPDKADLFGRDPQLRWNFLPDVGEDYEP